MSTLTIADLSGRAIRRIDLHGRDRLTIGRSTQRDLIINDPAISRFHCMLYFEAGSWCIADAGSRSGTRIEGHPVVWKRLPPGRVANIGHLLLWIEDTATADVVASSNGDQSRNCLPQYQPDSGCHAAPVDRAPGNGTSNSPTTSAFLTAETDFLIPADRIPRPAR